MSRQTVILTCRLVSLWIFFQAFFSAFGVFRILFPPFAGMMHEPRTVLSSGNMALQFGSPALIETLAEIALGMFFYYCGPNAVRFLFGTTFDEISDETHPEPTPE